MGHYRGLYENPAVAVAAVVAAAVVAAAVVAAAVVAAVAAAAVAAAAVAAVAAGPVLHHVVAVVDPPLAGIQNPIPGLALPETVLLHRA